MSTDSTLSIRLELFWWVFTAIVAFGILYPILSTTDNYPFLLINIIFIIVFITFTRYLFLLRHTFLAKRQMLKAAVIVICIPLIFYLINGVNYFQTYLDENGLESFLGALPLDRQNSMGGFIRNEMLLFGVGSVLVAMMMPFRMIISIWRTHNRGTV